MSELDLVQPMLACSPLLAVQMLISAATAAAGYSSQRNQAKATAEHQKVVGNLQMKQGVLNQSDAIARNAAQEEANHMEQQDIMRKSSMVQAAGTVSALESGAEGGVLAALQGEYMQREAQLMYASQQESELASNQLDRDLDRMRMQGKAQMATTFRPINQPSGAAFALQAGGEMAGAYGDYEAANPDK